MLDYSNNILSLTFEDLSRIGLTAGYLKRAVSGQRKGDVYCWEHHKIGRNIFIHYHALLPKYKELIKTVFCAGAEPEDWLSNKETN